MRARRPGGRSHASTAGSPTTRSGATRATSGTRRAVRIVRPAGASRHADTCDQRSDPHHCRASVRDAAQQPADADIPHRSQGRQALPTAGELAPARHDAAGSGQGQAEAEPPGGAGRTPSGYAGTYPGTVMVSRAPERSANPKPGPGAADLEAHRDSEPHVEAGQSRSTAVHRRRYARRSAVLDVNFGPLTWLSEQRPNARSARASAAFDQVVAPELGRFGPSLAPDDGEHGGCVRRRFWTAFP